jgi:hypothetical protein
MRGMISEGGFFRPASAQLIGPFPTAGDDR